MNAQPHVETPVAAPLETVSHGSRKVVLFILVLIALIGGALFYGLRYHKASSGVSSSVRSYPVGVPNTAEPSGEGPPTATALQGYRLVYENDFPGDSVPSGWYVFNGVPGGEPGGRFATNHVVVRNGLLSLDTFKDPAYGNTWVTGGLCQCGVPRTYGAYFVRSRVTGPGPNEVELLWPFNNKWPPEIDFNESGGSMDSTSSTIHFEIANYIDQRSVSVGLGQWHTWGVVWSPSSITYVLDGKVWGSVTARDEIPTTKMTLDFEQRTLCNLGRECPAHPVALQVDWVAEYVKKR